MITNTKVDIRTHPKASELADYLSGKLTASDRIRIEEHISVCDECLAAVVSAHESAGKIRKKASILRKVIDMIKKINIFLTLAIITFALSFILPRYFVQLLVATLILGVKWIVDAKTTKMLVMIYEAWKSGGEKEASKVLERIDGRF